MELACEQDCSSAILFLVMLVMKHAILLMLLEDAIKTRMKVMGVPEHKGCICTY